MPKFDVNLWKTVHPPSTEGSGIVRCIKEWEHHVPEKFPAEHDDPKELLRIVNVAAKQFLTAIADAESKLARDKAADPKLKDKLVKTKALLGRWKSEISSYQKLADKWSQGVVKEQVQEKKAEDSAQKELNTLLLKGLDVALSKLPPLAKEFDAALKARNLDLAAAKLRLHRELLTKAAYLGKPVAVATERHKVAAKYKMDAMDLKIPPQFNQLLQKLGTMSTADDDMDDRLGRALEGEIEDEADPTSTPEYRKASREVADAYKAVGVKMKALIPQFGQFVASAKLIEAVRPADPNVKKTVLNCVALNQKMLVLHKAMQIHRKQYLGSSSPLTKKLVAAELAEKDVKKLVDPQLKLFSVYSDRVIDISARATEILQDWLEEVVKSNPQMSDAKAELDNVRSRKYWGLVK